VCARARLAEQVKDAGEAFAGGKGKIEDVEMR
jgi:hypothetical protein